MLPKLYFAHKKKLFYTAVITCYLIIVFVPLLAIPKDAVLPPGPDAPPIPQSILPFIENSSLFNFILVFILSFLLKSNQRLTEIQNDKLKSEVRYLKAQIKPHFFFNTLNSIYSLTLAKSDQAPDAVLKLSSMMRYVVAESSREQVSLEKEMEYIKNYINLQQLRMDESTDMAFTVTGSYAGKNISPLLLIPFIENAFKFGLNTEKESAISIGIAITDEELSLTVINKKVYPNVPKDEKNGQGIENTRQRLQYMYPDKHKLTIFDTQDTFTVNLSINLA